MPDLLDVVSNLERVGGEYERSRCGTDLSLPFHHTRAICEYDPSALRKAKIMLDKMRCPDNLIGLKVVTSLDNRLLHVQKLFTCGFSVGAFGQIELMITLAESRSDDLLLSSRNAFASIDRSSRVDLPILELVLELYVDILIGSLGLSKDLIETGYCPGGLVIANH